MVSVSANSCSRLASCLGSAAAGLSHSGLSPVLRFQLTKIPKLWGSQKLRDGFSKEQNIFFRSLSCALWIFSPNFLRENPPPFFSEEVVILEIRVLSPGPWGVSPSTRWLGLTFRSLHTFMFSLYVVFAALLQRLCALGTQDIPFPVLHPEQSSWLS